MRGLFHAAALAALLAAGTVAAQPAPGPGPMPPAAGPVVDHTEVFTPMRDGVKLAANLYLPKGAGPWPVIVMRTPYLKDGQIAKFFNPGRYTDAGFAFVLQDVRGKGHSQGFYSAFNDDIADGYDTVEWLAVQPWSTGKVGITGASAMGIAANLAAVSRPPHLTAAYVIVAPADRHANNFMGGVMKENDTVGWMKGQGESAEVIARTQAAAADNYNADRTDMPDGRKYIDIPIYNVGGWYDIFENGNTANFTWLQNHGAKGARGNQKLYMGPFSHGALSGDLAYPGADSMMANNDQELRWFDYWLKGNDNGIMDEPPVRYMMMAGARKGAYSPKNHFVEAANWPPASRQVRYYVTADHALTTKAPRTDQAPIRYRFDPAHPVPTVGGANLLAARGPMDQRAIGERQDYLRFTTPVLAKDVSIAGAVSVEVWGASDGPDTDFMAKLVDVYPDGYEAIVLDAPIRARYRGGMMPDDVRMMTPGAPQTMTIDLWSTALTFEAGHKIELTITSSNSPRFEVNPNTGEAPGSHKLAPRVATNSIYLDADHPTALVLPVVYP